MILVIDNYDSFVFNLARYVQELGVECIVKRNNKITIDEIVNDIKPSHIILSPGPGAPDSAGICLQLVAQLHRHIPMLGVCLGHQVIGQALGGQIVKAKNPLHGQPQNIRHDGEGLFKAIKNPLQVGLYHSLVVAKDLLPTDFHINAYSESGDIMAFQHRQLPIYGVQFHPESILTECGIEFLANFLATEVTRTLTVSPGR